MPIIYTRVEFVIFLREQFAGRLCDISTYSCCGHLHNGLEYTDLCFCLDASPFPFVSPWSSLLLVFNDVALTQSFHSTFLSQSSRLNPAPTISVSSLVLSAFQHGTVYLV